VAVGAAVDIGSYSVHRFAMSMSKYGDSFRGARFVEAKLGEQVVWSRRGFSSGAPNAEVFLRRRLAD